MEGIDANVERRVWQRVYDCQSPKPRLSQRQRDALHRCLKRTEANLAVYESLRNHPVYAEAFTRLADETREHSKMLRQMLGNRQQTKE